MANRPRPGNLPPPEQPPRPKGPTAQTIAAAAPWLPVPYEPADAIAWQAIAGGRADEAQQKRALQWLIDVAAGTYDMPYHPGHDGSRNTDFACGRMYVGQQVRKLLKLNPGLLKGSITQADKIEPR